MSLQAAALSRRESAESPGAEHTREQQGWLSWVSWGLLGAGGSSIDAGGFTGAISDKDLKASILDVPCILSPSLTH